MHNSPNSDQQQTPSVCATASIYTIHSQIIVILMSFFYSVVVATDVLLFFLLHIVYVLMIVAAAAAANSWNIKIQAEIPEQMTLMLLYWHIHDTCIDTHVAYCILAQQLYDVIGLSLLILFGSFFSRLLFCLGFVIRTSLYKELYTIRICLCRSVSHIVC